MTDKQQEYFGTISNGKEAEPFTMERFKECIDIINSMPKPPETPELILINEKFKENKEVIRILSYYKSIGNGDYIHPLLAPIKIIPDAYFPKNKDEKECIMIKVPKMPKLDLKWKEIEVKMASNRKL